MTKAHPQSIVVGVDGSKASRAALHWAAEEAELREADLHVVNVHDARVGGVIAAPGVAIALDTMEIEQTLKQLATDLDTVIADELGPKPPVRVWSSVPIGNPAQVLIDTAGRERARMLVLGNRGNGGFKKLLLGSVSEQCVTHAATPVVVIHADVDTDQVRDHE